MNSRSGSESGGADAIKNEPVSFVSLSSPSATCPNRANSRVVVSPPSNQRASSFISSSFPDARPKPKILTGSDLQIWQGIHQPRGGGYDACLSASDIDRVVRPLIGDSYVPADAFFRVRTGRAVGNDLARRLHTICDSGNWAYAAVHVRHHWTLGVFDLTESGDLRAFIYDSAPSLVTRKDIFQVLEQCGIHHVVFVRCGKQPRGSVECGVHVVLHAWRTFLGYDALAPRKTIELAHLRAICAKLAKKFDQAEVERIAETPGHKIVKEPAGGASNAAQLAELAKMNANFARASPCEALERLRDKKVRVRVVIKFRLDEDDAHEYEATGSLRASFRPVRTYVVDLDVPEGHDAVAIQFGGGQSAVLTSASSYSGGKIFFVQHQEEEPEELPEPPAPVARPARPSEDAARNAPPPAVQAAAREPPQQNRAPRDLVQPQPPSNIPRRDVAELPALFRCSQAQPPALAAMKGDALMGVIVRAPSLPLTLAEQGLVKEVRARHRRILLDAQRELQPWHHLPLEEALMEWMAHRRVTRKWAWSTTHREMANLQGALAALPLYTDAPVPILLKFGPTWISAMKKACKSMKESESLEPPACPIETLREAAAKAEPWVRAALHLTWLAAARTGCILQLKRYDVAYKEATGQMKITFRRGKGVAFSGPYTVPTLVPEEWREDMKKFLASRRPDEFLFPAATPSERASNSRMLLEALRAVDPSMGQKAIRRGSLQYLGRLGVGLDKLMIFSGHKRKDTLLRYLRWGQDAEELVRETEDAARLFGGRASGSSRRAGPTLA